MPPKIRFSKADILHAAFKITRENGLDAVNARAIARELGCSTQPIFRAFNTMDEIKSEVVRMGMDMYCLSLTSAGMNAKRPYMGIGIAYIQFAREEPELFKLLLMCDRTNDAVAKEREAKTMAFVIDTVMQKTGLSREKAKQFHQRLWIYTHGLASMIATRYWNKDFELVEQLLADGYEAMRLLYGLKKSPEA
ncbi:MAG: WHG domain-containing protein [Eubacteriales bacterium]|nr:WHG domain-containing protein [Eubacteriales bacterium]